MSIGVEEQQYNSGEVILFPGAARYLYRVRSGLVRLHLVDEQGNGLTLRYVKPGGFFGEESLAGETRAHFAEAVSDSVLEVCPPDALEPALQRELSNHLAGALLGLYGALHRISGKRLRSRVAAELLELRDSAIAVSAPSGDAIIHITHDDLAAAVGSVRETVTKVIGELAREGALEAGYGKIILRNVGTLERVAGE
jgi:CRP/FNR family transcriptional regulator, cyclic AMP receptor protein